jgi:hypothetical protein
MHRPLSKSLKWLAVSLTIVVFAVIAAVLSCSRQFDVQTADVLAGYDDSAEYSGLTIDYPLNETLFPPEIAPPTLHWTDSNVQCDTWLVTIKFPDDQGRASFLTDVPQWTPEPAQWEQVKQRSLEQEATVAVLGVNRSAPQTILSGARVTISTSVDAVGAPLFYREVNLPFIEAVKELSRTRR